MLTKTLSEAKKKQRNILIKAMNNDIGSIDSAKDSWNPAQISERAKDISYIRSLVDTWNPAQLNEALKMLDLPVIDTWNPAQIEEQRRNLVFYLSERTLTGNPITLKILGNLTPEVTGLKVTMNPIQSGTGDPSPTNIRPISGRTEVSVTRTGKNLNSGLKSGVYAATTGVYQGQTYTATFPDTVYGGTWNATEGKAVIEWVSVDMGDIDYTYSNNMFRFRPSDGIKSGDIGANADDFMCSIYSRQSDKVIGVQNLENMKCAKTASPTACSYYFRDDNYSTIEAFKTAMSGQSFCYKLVTPTTISTSAEEITLLKGENVLSTDGDSIELKYKQNF